MRSLSGTSSEARFARRQLRLWICLLLAGAVPGLADSSLPATVGEQRYRVELADQPAGTLVLRETRNAQTLVSETEMTLAVRRGASEVKLEMASRFEEGHDGTPRNAWTRQLLGPSPVETEYRFTASEIVVISRHGGEESQERQRLPEVAWLTPGQTQRALTEHLTAGDEQFSLRTIDPLMGLSPIDVEWTLQSRDSSVQIGETTIATSRWHQTQSVAPQLINVVELDASGRMVRSQTPILGMTMQVTLLPDGEIGETPVEAPEILVSTFLEPDRPIRNPRQLRRAVYELRRTDGAPLDDLPSAAAQRFERLDGQTRVVVDLDQASETEEEDSAAFLQASTYIDHDHPRIGELAQQALVGVADGPAARAEALRVFVSGHLDSKHLETALATAGEAALSRSGDCTEHSVLLAALLRANGIPSRVASGVVYLERFLGQDHIFGYHMWTQARIDGRWIDLDATLPGPFDATHIAFALTALNDDQEALIELGRLAPLIGRLEVRVLETGPASPQGASD